MRVRYNKLINIMSYKNQKTIFVIHTKCVPSPSYFLYEPSTNKFLGKNIVSHRWGHFEHFLCSLGSIKNFRILKRKHEGKFLTFESVTELSPICVQWSYSLDFSLLDTFRAYQKLSLLKFRLWESPRLHCQNEIILSQKRMSKL